MGNIVRSSGFINPDTKFPFSTIQKIATIKVGGDTCNSLEEESLYEFHTFTNSRRQLTKIQEAIQNRYDYASFSVVNRNFMGIFWDGFTILEPEPGMYHGIQRYRVLAERLFSERMNLGTTEGETFLECIYKRYLASANLTSYLREFSTTTFVPEKTKYPYCVIPQFIAEPNQWDTFGYLEEITFSFSIWDTSAETVEKIKEILMDEYHFANFEIANRIFCSLAYESDTLIEQEEGIWNGTVDYSLINVKEK